MVSLGKVSEVEWVSSESRLRHLRLMKRILSLFVDKSPKIFSWRKVLSEFCS